MIIACEGNLPQAILNMGRGRMLYPNTIVMVEFCSDGTGDPIAEQVMDLSMM